MIFNVGDVIIGKKSSEVYGYTCKSNNFVGEVMKIVDVSSDGVGIKKEIRVKIIENSKKQHIGKQVFVDPKHFKLKKPELIEIDISKSKRKGDFRVYRLADDIQEIIIKRCDFNVCKLYISENDLTFKEAKEMLKILGYKLVKGDDL